MKKERQAKGTEFRKELLFYVGTYLGRPQGRGYICNGDRNVGSRQAIVAIHEKIVLGRGNGGYKTPTQESFRHAGEMPEGRVAVAEPG